MEFVGDKWDSDKDVIQSSDLFILRSADYFKLYICPDDHCGYNTNHKQHFEDHIATCGKQENIQYKQKMMTEEHIRSWCIQHNYIDADYHQMNFCAFDIETLAKPVNMEMTSNSFMFSTQRVVTIAVTKSWGEPSKRSVVFKRNRLISIVHTNDLDDQFRNI